MAVSGISCRKPSVGTGWAISHLLCINGFRKQFPCYVVSPFLAVKLFTGQSILIVFVPPIFLYPRAG